MISKLSKRIAQYLADKNKIDGDEIDLYHYGLFVMISEFFLMFCSLVIGIIFKIPLQGVIFYLVFFITHRYAGGFHAKTEFHCQAVTLPSFFIGIACIKLAENASFALLVAIPICCLAIMAILCPADTPQKELTRGEKLRFKKITVVLISAITLLVVLLFKLGVSSSYIGAIVFAVLLETISVVFGRAFNGRLRDESET